MFVYVSLLMTFLCIFECFNYLAETKGCSRISKGAIQRSGEPSSKDTYSRIIEADWKLGWGPGIARRDAIPKVSPQRLIECSSVADFVTRLDLHLVLLQYIYSLYHMKIVLTRHKIIASVFCVAFRRKEN